MGISSVKKTNRNLRLGIMEWTCLGQRGQTSVFSNGSSSGLKVKSTKQKVFGTERITHRKAKVRKKCCMARASGAKVRIAGGWRGASCQIRRGLEAK